MRIHSSSLTFTHAGFNRPQAGLRSSAPNKDERIVLPVAADTSSSQSSEAIKPIADIAETNHYFVPKENAVPLRDSRVLKALAAYRQELGKVLPDQHTPPVAKVIDTYA